MAQLIEKQKQKQLKEEKKKKEEVKMKQKKEKMALSEDALRKHFIKQIIKYVDSGFTDDR